LIREGDSCRVCATPSVLSKLLERVEKPTEEPTPEAQAETESGGALEKTQEGDTTAAESGESPKKSAQVSTTEKQEAAGVLEKIQKRGNDILSRGARKGIKRLELKHSLKLLSI